MIRRPAKQLTNNKMPLIKQAIQQSNNRISTNGFPSECEECGDEYMKSKGSKYCVMCRSSVMSRNERIRSKRRRQRIKRDKDINKFNEQNYEKINERGNQES